MNIYVEIGKELGDTLVWLAFWLSICGGLFKSIKIYESKK